jgi:hypothetical protein
MPSKTMMKTPFHDHVQNLREFRHDVKLPVIIKIKKTTIWQKKKKRKKKK